MKKRVEARDSIIQVEDDDDHDFLSQVAAAEARALSSSNPNKRPKIILPSPKKTSEIKMEKEVKEAVVEEGAYLSALRGSKSLLWEKHQQSLRSRGSKGITVFGGGGGGGGAAGNYGDDTSIPEKACACGLGICVVLTANTEKNRGRKFYKCPLRLENGGCGFFEWCDNSSGTSNTTYGNHGTNNTRYGNQNCASNPPFPDFPCPCGAGTCRILTAKTGKNIGQQFYRCPENQGSCSFFKWCNDNAGAASFPVSASKVHNMADTSNKSYGVRSSYNMTEANDKSLTEANDKSFGVRAGSSCFKCGKEGHWAKDCSGPLSSSPADLGGRPSSSGTCFKCGKLGHWARNCSSSH